MRLIYLLSVFMHILAAAAWLGGAFFIIIMLVPSIRKNKFRQTGSALMKDIGPRLRTTAWISFLILLLTGIFNFIYRFGTDSIVSVSFWQTSVGTALAVKLVLVLAIVLISLYHDFAVGPAASTAMMNDPMSKESQALRRKASLCGRLNTILGLMAVFAAVIIVRG